MRQLIRSRSLRRTRGFTLVELMVTIAIAGLLAVMALPSLTQYVANARLREGANTLLSASAFARSEAVKSNEKVTLEISGRNIQISRIDPTTSAKSLVRSTVLPESVAASSPTATFDSTGRLTPFGTDIIVGVTSTSQACGGDIRCPAVHLEPGGAITMCSTGVCP